MRKFVDDNLYENQIPYFLIARIKKVDDKYINSNIIENKDNKGKITFRVKPKSAVFVHKRSFHSSINVYFDRTKLLLDRARTFITPLVEKENKFKTLAPKTNQFSTLCAMRRY